MAQVKICALLRPQHRLIHLDIGHPGHGRVLNGKMNSLQSRLRSTALAKSGAVCISASSSCTPRLSSKPVRPATAVRNGATSGCARRPAPDNCGMTTDTNQSLPVGCEGCRNVSDLGFDFAMAFQPIVNVSNRTVFAHEALVRGPNGEGAMSVLSQVTDKNRYSFDQTCRVKAIEQAAALGMKSMLSINFLPNAVYRAEACIRLTLATAKKHNFPAEQIMFEVTESEQSKDLAHLKSIFRDYEQRGFTTAIDDFGAGYAGFDFLVEFLPDIIKIDMALLRGIDSNRPRQIIVSGFAKICRELDVRVLAEGVETRAEFDYLRSIGIDLYQGYLFAKPAFKALPPVDWAAIGL